MQPQPPSPSPLDSPLDTSHGSLRLVYLNKYIGMVSDASWNISGYVMFEIYEIFQLNLSEEYNSILLIMNNLYYLVILNSLQWHC